MEYEIITSEIIVKPVGNSTYSEAVTRVGIDDEAAGCFVTIKQLESEIRIDVAEWKFIKEAIESMVKLCESQNKKICG